MRNFKNRSGDGRERKCEGESKMRGVGGGGERGRGRWRKREGTLPVDQLVREIMWLPEKHPLLSIFSIAEETFHNVP